MPAGGGQDRARGVDGRAVQDALVHRAGQVDPQAPDLTHRGDAGVQRGAQVPRRPGAAQRQRLEHQAPQVEGPGPEEMAVAVPHPRHDRGRGADRRARRGRRGRGRSRVADPRPVQHDYPVAYRLAAARDEQFRLDSVHAAIMARRGPEGPTMRIFHRQYRRACCREWSRCAIQDIRLSGNRVRALRARRPCRRAQGEAARQGLGTTERYGATRPGPARLARKAQPRRTGPAGIGARFASPPHRDRPDRRAVRLRGARPGRGRQQGPHPHGHGLRGHGRDLAHLLLRLPRQPAVLENPPGADRAAGAGRGRGAPGPAAPVVRTVPHGRPGAGVAGARRRHPDEPAEHQAHLAARRRDRGLAARRGRARLAAGQGRASGRPDVRPGQRRAGPQARRCRQPGPRGLGEGGEPRRPLRRPGPPRRAPVTAPGPRPRRCPTPSTPRATTRPPRRCPRRRSRSRTPWPSWTR